MIAFWLDRLLRPPPFTLSEAAGLLARLTDAETEEAERTALLAALCARPVRPEEDAAFAEALLQRALPFPVPASERALDFAGTGGSRVPSFNVSTVSAFVASGAGASVVKHGNRSARHPCGSTDLLLALGLPVDRGPEFARESYERSRLAFLHAPVFHPATRAVARARAIVGIPTIFNRLGPLVNPARPPFHVLGVAAEADLAPIVEVRRRLGALRVLAMSAPEGCDEFSPQRPTKVLVAEPGGVTERLLRPDRYLAREEQEGDWGMLAPASAAEEVRRLLAGGLGARRGAVLLTAAAGLWISRQAASFGEGVQLARRSIDRGKAEEKLRELEALARSAPPAPSEAP